MSLPEVEEILTWETDITFRVRRKIFTIGGELEDHISVKATPIFQAELLDLDPETFASAPDVGCFGWVTVNLSRVDPGMLESLLRDAWRSSRRRSSETSCRTEIECRAPSAEAKPASGKVKSRERRRPPRRDGLRSNARCSRADG